MYCCLNYWGGGVVSSMEFYTIMYVSNIPGKFLTTTWSPQKDLDAIHVHTATSWHHVQDLQDP
jgi:L-ribulose-5-phosphate 3-epimerase UlaE